MQVLGNKMAQLEVPQSRLVERRPSDSAIARRRSLDIPAIDLECVAQRATKAAAAAVAPVVAEVKPARAQRRQSDASDSDVSYAFNDSDASDAEEVAKPAKLPRPRLPIAAKADVTGRRDSLPPTITMRAFFKMASEMDIKIWQRQEEEEEELDFFPACLSDEEEVEDDQHKEEDGTDSEDEEQPFPATPCSPNRRRLHGRSKSPLKRKGSSELRRVSAGSADTEHLEEAPPSPIPATPCSPNRRRLQNRSNSPLKRKNNAEPRRGSTDSEASTNIGCSEPATPLLQRDMRVAKPSRRRSMTSCKEEDVLDHEDVLDDSTRAGTQQTMLAQDTWDDLLRANSLQTHSTEKEQSQVTRRLTSELVCQAASSSDDYKQLRSARLSLGTSYKDKSLLTCERVSSMRDPAESDEKLWKLRIALLDRFEEQRCRMERLKLLLPAAFPHIQDVRWKEDRGSRKAGTVCDSGKGAEHARE